MRVVIKLGGSVLSETSLRLSLVYQISELRHMGSEIVLVHGGGKQIAAMLERLNIESRFYDGLRITDKGTRDVVQMVLAGKVGKDLVADLSRLNVPAVSLAGGDGMSFMSHRLRPANGTDLGYVGQVARTRPDLIEALLRINMVPAIACLTLGAHDNEYYNVNGDQMAAAVAATCHADELIFVTDVGGVKDANGEQIPQLDRAGITELLDTGVAGGGMRPKLRACLEALDAGVRRIVIIGAAEEMSLQRTLKGEALGTAISP
ncbi:MAG TPA: acetylglutamate kinase [Blastocatellia bacterium]|nr:acetylglutamate kinase [Blastocatellia bacterium]